MIRLVLVDDQEVIRAGLRVIGEIGGDGDDVLAINLLNFNASAPLVAVGIGRRLPGFALVIRICSVFR